jgi:hypothetical protein
MDRSTWKGEVMRNRLKIAVVGTSIVAATFALATPALANSFSKNVGDGTISYDDASDRFCAQAFNTDGARQVRVHLVPISRSGPSPEFTDKNNYYGDSGATCSTALSSAYEDTYYRADVETYSGERGTWVNRGSSYFYS